MLDVLALLVDKSLVIAETAGGPTRYRLLETIRQYAQEKLSESAEAVTVRDRHRDHYTAMAAALDAPANASLELLLDQAETEIDNLRAAFAWSRENSDIDSALLLADVPAAAVADAGLTSRRDRTGWTWVWQTPRSQGADVTPSGDGAGVGRQGIRGQHALRRKALRERSVHWQSHASSMIRHCWRALSPPAAASPPGTPTWPGRTCQKRRIWPEPSATGGG